MVYLKLVPDLHDEVLNVIVLDVELDLANGSVYFVAQARPVVKWLNNAIDNKRHSINIHISKKHGYSDQGLLRIFHTLNQLIVEELDFDEAIDSLGLSNLTVPLNTGDGPCALIWPASERAVITRRLERHIVENQEAAFIE